MLVSVLLPSRGRPQMCLDSIKSLGKGRFEVLVYLDKDDPKVQSYLLKLSHMKHVKIFIRERTSYVNFQDMINFLAAEAKGDWLLLWNDDAFIRGKWLWVAKQHDPEKVNVLRFGNSINNLNLFPAISRKMYELQGYYSLSPHCDSWAMDISQTLGCERWEQGMEIEHRRDWEDLQDDTKAHTMESYSVTIPKHSDLQPQMNEMIEKLRPYV